MKNKLTENTPFAEKSLEEIILSSEGGIFNNAAQIWNHTFYFNCLTPEKTSPSQEVKNALETSFTSIENFKAEFTQKAITTFGSGWAWLCVHSGGAAFADCVRVCCGCGAHMGLGHVAARYYRCATCLAKPYFPDCV